MSFLICIEMVIMINDTWLMIMIHRYDNNGYSFFDSKALAEYSLENVSSSF